MKNTLSVVKENGTLYSAILPSCIVVPRKPPFERLVRIWNHRIFSNRATMASTDDDEMARVSTTELDHSWTLARYTRQAPRTSHNHT